MQKPGPVIGVVGGSGGVGASTFAAVLALVAGRSVLIDLDVAGGGIDVVLGVETATGARWSGLRLAGGHLDPDVLVDGLPRAGPCSVLAADTERLDPEAVLEVLAAARAAGPVIVDLPRRSCPERAAAVACCDLVVVVARADVAGLVAAHATVAQLPEVLPVGVVVRNSEIDAHEAADLVGAPLLGVLPVLGSGHLTVDFDKPPRRLATIAAGVLAGVRGQAARHSAELIA